MENIDNPEIKAISDKVDSILKKISILISDEIEDFDDENTLPLLFLVLTKLSANLLLGFQKCTDDYNDVTEHFIKHVRDLMPIIKREIEIEACEEKIKETSKRIAELEQKRDNFIMKMFVKNDGPLN